MQQDTERYKTFFSILIANANTRASGSLANKGYFKNNSNGVIDIHDIIATSSIISSFQSTARFDNHGDIYSIDNVINGASVAVNSSGRFYNYATGNIYVENCTGKGISASGNGDFRNLGLIDLYEVAGAGVHASSSVIKNFASGTILYKEGSYYGVSLWVNSVLQNHGTITVSNSPARSLFCYNNSSFINYDKGKFEIDNSIYLTHPDGLINYGHLSCKYNGNHYVPTNGIKNYGAIGDVYESLDGEIDNTNGIRVIPFQGNVQIDVPVANALDLGSLNNVSIENWTTTPNGNISAGTYNASNNTFTPNENAKELYVIYVRVEINGTSNSYVYPVPIPGGVQYFTGGGSSNFTVQGNNKKNQNATTRNINNSSTISLKTYPNPTSDFLFVETNSAFDENLSVQFLNHLGQTLWQEEIVSGESRVSFPIPGSLANGDYVLTLWKNGEIIKTEKVVVVH